MRLGSSSFDASEALEHLRSKDRVLGRFVDSFGPFAYRAQKAPSTFGALARAIVYQQLNGKAAAAIFARVQAVVGDPDDPDQHVEAERVTHATDEALRAAGLSASKLASMRDLARRTAEGTVPTIRQAQRMTDEEVVERLVEVRGIGRWTAEMFLIFRLGRPDVLPLDDFGVRKGFAYVFGLAGMPAKAEVAKRGERWSPYRSVASWYLWRAAEIRNPAPSTKPVQSTEPEADVAPAP